MEDDQKTTTEETTTEDTTQTTTTDDNGAVDDANKANEDETYEEEEVFDPDAVESDDKKSDKGDDEDEDDDFEDEDTKLDKLVDKKFSERERKEKRTEELENFLSSDDNKLYKPFANKIRELAKNPALQGLKVSAIANMAAGKNLLKIGARLEREATQKTQQRNTGADNNTSKRDGEIKPGDILKMSKEEYKKYKEKNGFV